MCSSRRREEFAHAEHQLLGQFIGCDDLQIDRVGRSDALRVGFVQEVERTFTGVGALIGAIAWRVAQTRVM